MPENVDIAGFAVPIADTKPAGGPLVSVGTQARPVPDAPKERIIIVAPSATGKTDLKKNLGPKAVDLDDAAVGSATGSAASLAEYAGEAAVALAYDPAVALLLASAKPWRHARKILIVAPPAEVSERNSRRGTRVSVDEAEDWALKAARDLASWEQVQLTSGAYLSDIAGQLGVPMPPKLKKAEDDKEAGQNAKPDLPIGPPSKMRTDDSGGDWED